MDASGLPTLLNSHSGTPRFKRAKISSTEIKVQYRTTTEVPSKAIHAYTDGGCNNNGQATAFSAWGCCVFEPGYEPTRGEIQSTLWEAHGGVTLDAHDPLYIGAEKHTNNVGEITAIVEMCVWLHHQVISKAISSSNHIVIHTDSSYARNILLGKWAARQNKTLCMLAKVLLHRLMTLIPVHLVWVRGHSGTFGNDEADSLATDGLDPFLRIPNHCRDPIFADLSWGILQNLSKHEPLQAHVKRIGLAPQYPLTPD